MTSLMRRILLKRERQKANHGGESLRTATTVTNQTRSQKRPSLRRNQRKNLKVRNILYKFTFTNYFIHTEVYCYMLDSPVFQSFYLNAFVDSFENVMILHKFNDKLHYSGGKILVLLISFNRTEFTPIL